MQKILLIDDDNSQLEYLGNLFKNDYECNSFSNPFEAISAIVKTDYSCVITDLHMPIVNGVSLIKKIRELKGNSVPILVFSNDFSISSKLSCLELKIYDYLHSSMGEEEICLRVSNALSNSRILQFDQLVINEESMLVRYGKEFIEVTQIEYKILLLLLRNKNKVQKKDLINFIWPNSFVLEKTLNTHMTNLRTKLKPKFLNLVTTKDDSVVLFKDLNGFCVQNEIV